MTAKELLSKVEDIDLKLYYNMGEYRQFTIDTIDDILDELNNHLQEPFQVLTDDDLVGSLIYRIKSIMGICDPRLLDYNIFEELLYLMKEDYDNSKDNGEQ